ncbi:hypothetical protein GCM10022261_25960 [Brevibacterium daeguense]|uniref:DUF3017 domain-containing protein n=1 Tax=Brevibacterium daeguense TaxID=909936 RepID=A0ABP8EM47_9MICO|nr:hypothetical protein [Brevibacterium daeguense]
MALGPAALAAVRCLPAPWGEVWVNRSRTVDVFTLLLAAVSLTALTLVVPST